MVNHVNQMNSSVYWPEKEKTMVENTDDEEDKDEDGQGSEGGDGD